MSSDPSDTVPTARRRAPDPRMPVRARHLLRVRAVWAIPLAVASVVIAVMTGLYISAVVNPQAHVRGLPVAVVNQDRGATAGAQHLDIGQQVQAGLLASPAVSGRLRLEMSTLPQAEQAMGRDGLYATLMIPRGFTASLLNVAGRHRRDRTRSGDLAACAGGGLAPDRPAPSRPGPGQHAHGRDQGAAGQPRHGEHRAVPPPASGHRPRVERFLRRAPDDDVRVHRRHHRELRRGLFARLRHH
jgi:YhgE/Pip-like protein